MPLRRVPDSRAFERAASFPMIERGRILRAHGWITALTTKYNEMFIVRLTDGRISETRGVVDVLSR